MIVINEDIRVMKQEFKGKSYVSIRKWYQDNGEWKPGKQGINLTAICQLARHLHSV